MTKAAIKVAPLAQSYYDNMFQAKAVEPPNNTVRRTHGRHLPTGIIFFHTINTYMDLSCIAPAAGAMQKYLNIDDITMDHIFGIFAIGY